MMQDDKIKVFFDGDCPLCSKEMRWIKSRDKKDKVILEDISLSTFNPSVYDKTIEEFNSKIYAQLSDGQLIHGVEVFRKVYAAIGLGWLMVPTNIPILRNIFDFAYKIFARHRIKIGSFFGRKGCDANCKF